MREIAFSDIKVDSFARSLILLDIDGTIAPDGTVATDNPILQKISELKKQHQVFFCSNKKNSDTRNVALTTETGIGLIPMQNKKPSVKILSRVPNPEHLPLVVIGDKFCIDGLFAQRIGAQFVKVKRITAATDTLGTKLVYMFDDMLFKIAMYVRLIRPWQWVKNLFVFVPLFFARELYVVDKTLSATAAFVAFSLTASSVYVLNDWVDRANDALHPTKKHRPLASGALSSVEAGILLAVLAFLAAWVATVFVPQIIPVLVVYGALNILYSFFLKRKPLFDILLVASFYLLRIEAGGLATATPLSRWLILCTLFSTLCIIIGKRKSELVHANKREVLRFYSNELLGTLLTVSTTVTIVTYSIYSILGTTSPLAVYSIIFVLLGIFRYLLILSSATGISAEYPEKLIFKDKVILGSGLAWACYMFFIFYLN